MSTIDSGLGWSCDSDYYVADNSTIATYNGTDIKKTNNGGAVVCQVYMTKYNDNSIIAMSTIKENTYLNVDSYFPDGAHSTVIDGVIWWYYLTNNHVIGTVTANVPTVTVYDRLDTAGFLEAASVEKTAIGIVSTNFLKEFVEGVEAETVTRVNALDAAKQPKTMSAPVSVGGVSQSTVESAIGAISKKTSLLADKNRSLGTDITAAQKLAIANGTFEDLPIGAYWTLNGTVYRIAHHDYYLRTGSPECTSHHIVVVPDNSMYSAVMNDTSTTTGGYANSKMRKTNLATALSTFETDFGVAHILNHRILVTNAVSDGQASGLAWVDSKVDLMSENMVFGHPVWGNTGYETGIERGQLVLFSLYPKFIQKQRFWYWLRSVGSGSGFCYVDSVGFADYSFASGSFGVRPYACIYFDDVL